MKKLSLILFIFLTASFVYPELCRWANAANFNVSSYGPQQGDTVVIYFNLKPQSVSFGNQAVDVFAYKNFNIVVIPISAVKTPGNYPLKIIFSANNIVSKTIKVKAKNFPKIVLGIPEQTGLTTTTLATGLQTGNQTINNIVATNSENIFFNQTFGLPLFNNKKIVSSFGEIRQTGSEQIRHLGVDFGANMDAAVAAMNNGVVSKAYFDSVYGNSVIIDHGHGIFSIYLHLDKIKVKENDAVKKGTLIGLVGQTGYATGPHLHLSIKINDVSVDPLKFISAFK